MHAGIKLNHVSKTGTQELKNYIQTCEANFHSLGAMKLHLVRLDEVFFLVIYCSLGVFDNFKEGVQCYPIP